MFSVVPSRFDFRRPLVVKFTVDTAGWSRAASALLAEQKKSSADFLKQQGRLLLDDMVRMTPPFRGGGGVTKQSHNEQRKIGQAAVRRDVGRVFLPAESMAFFNKSSDEKVQRWGKYLRKYAREGRLGAAQTMLRVAGFPNKVSTVARPYLHKRARSKRGRVPKSNERVIVLNTKSVRDYTREIVSHVGRSKAGWKHAASELKLFLPNWIKRHATPGTGGMITETKTHTSLDLGNLVEWASDFADLRIIQAALDGRTKAMVKNLERIIEAQIEKANRSIEVIAAGR